METPDHTPLPVSVIIPTLNEADNIDTLFARLPSVAEIIVVDDGDDTTAERARAHATTRPVTVIHRVGAERTGGLSTAVIAGIAASTAPYWCVIDGDLQHPPEMIASLYETVTARQLDVVVASRRNWDSINQGMSWVRRAASRGLGVVAFTLFRHDLHGVADPLSGFFMVRRRAVAPGRLDPTGFKILLEVLVTHPHLTTTELPFNFDPRHAGTPKGSPREAARYLHHVARLWTRRRRSQVAWSVVPGGVDHMTE